MDGYRVIVLALALSATGCSINRHDDWRLRTSEELSTRLGADLDADGVEERVKQLLGQPLNARRAVAVAMLNNPSVAALFERVGVARAELLSSASYANPVLDADLRFSSGGHFTVEAALVGSVLDLIFVPLRSRVAEATFLAEKARVTAEIVGLASDVRRGFIEYVTARQLVELREQVASATELSSDLSRRLYRAGNVTELAQLGDEVAALQSQLELSNAREREKVARERLNALLGLWGSDGEWHTDVQLADPCGEIKPREVLERCAVANSLTLEGMRHELNAASERAGFGAWDAVLGETGLGVSYAHEEDSDAFGPAISLPIPIFNWGRGAGAAAAAELRRLEYEYKASAIKIRADANAQWAHADGAERRATQLRSVILPLRHRITAETQRHYNAMLIGGFELFRAKHEEIEAGIAYLEALKEYWTARAAIDALLSGVTVEEQR